MAKARRRVRDTWKEKVWYEILAPADFEESSLGTSPAREPEMLVGRKIETSKEFEEFMKDIDHKIKTTETNRYNFDDIWDKI